MSAMENIEVLVLPQVPDEALHRIQNIDRRVKSIDARGWFDIELRATWPQWTVDRYLGARPHPPPRLAQRNRVLAAGGIGLAVAELCAAAGMRVVGTRRHVASATPLPLGFARLESSDLLLDLLGQSEFVAICCPWTKETTHLIGRAAFAAMKSETVLVNIARGEIIDEEALLQALADGRLRGVALDVYEGEFEHSPDRKLWNGERVVITPHVSAATDVSEHRGVDLFCKNLTRYLAGVPLENVIDWERGY